MRLNGLGEFEDDSPPRRTEVRTDAERREEALRKLVASGAVRVCDVCGKPFRTSDPYRRNAKRCSWECSREANRRRAREASRKRRGR